VLKLERFRRKPRKPKAGSMMVKAATAATRLEYTRNYLDWLAQKEIQKLNRTSDECATLELWRQTMVQQITARIPRGQDISVKKGLKSGQLKLLLKVIDPSSPLNPWKDPFCRVRNELIIKSFLALGNRKGEALGLRTTDVKQGERTVEIHRRPDNPTDPRLRKPATKTLPRTLPLKDDLTRKTLDYTSKWRRRLRAARKHHFLYVTRGGAPLSISALHRIFVDLRERVEGLPADLAAHVLRRTWNDEFSAQVDAKIEKLKGDKTLSTAMRDSMIIEIRAEEEAARRYAQGWRYGSKMPGLYSRRYIERRANEALLEMQRTIFEGKPREEDNGAK